MRVYDYNKIVEKRGNCGTVKESFDLDIGFARVKLDNGFTRAHFHKVTAEYYLVISGSGTLRIKGLSGTITDIELHPNIVVKIEPGEVHQTHNTDSLLLEAITIPAWSAEDEILTEETLF